MKEVYSKPIVETEVAFEANTAEISLFCTLLGNILWR